MSDSPVAQSLPFSYARRHNVFIGSMSQGESTVFYRDRLAPEVMAELMRLLDANFDVKQLPAEQFDHGLAQAYQRDSSTAMQMVEEMGDELDLVRLADAVSQTEDLLEQEDDAPIIRLINALLTEAIKNNASDIHIETYEKRLLVRFRIDGVLREMVQPRRELAPLLVSRIKVMARLDIAEKRVPQDGRISLKLGGREVDVRVSTLPANNGERVVMRLLDKQAGRLNLKRLGMPTELHNNFSQLLHRPHGIFLVTGPTGSGKTTTLYAGLGEINDNTRNILTVEDPIEYNLEGIGQTQVNTKADMTFARGLRAMLRQDPDVVMVGEIRDRETAEIAVQASLTGHLVLSTLHTNTAVGAITRLRDMGIEPFLLASSLLGILAQRLVRVLCPECKTPYAPSPRERELLEIAADDNVQLFHPNGCSHCNESGYKGRTGIYELLPVSEAVRQLIHSEAAEEAILKVVRQQYAGIRQDGRRCVLAGITTLEEVLRVTQEEI